MGVTLSRGCYARRGRNPQSLLDGVKLLRFAMFGSAGEDGTTGDGGSGAGGSGSPAGGSNGTGTDGGVGTGTGTPAGVADPDRDLPADVKERIKAANDEAAARRREHAEAQRLLDESQKKLREYEDKDKSELEKAQRDAAEFKAKAEAAAAKLQEQAVRLEFLANTKYAWHDAKASMKLLDLTDVKVAEDGAVSNLDKAIDKLAKDSPYLVKTDDGGPAPHGGPRPSNPRRGGDQGPDIQAMSRTFPALRTRSHISR